MTVEVDGRWYVTLLGTAGEYVAEATGNQGGDYDDVLKYLKM